MANTTRRWTVSGLFEYGAGFGREKGEGQDSRWVGGVSQAGTWNKEPAEVAVVEPETEKPKEEEPEAKPVRSLKEEPAEAVTPAEPKEETQTEPVVAVTPAEVVLPKKLEPKENQLK